MANTYTSLYYHVVFSTKRREQCLSVDVRRELWAYLGGIARNDGVAALEIGGFSDHVHLLLSIPTRIAVADTVKSLKGGSTPWIKSRFSGMHTFAWQDGYSAFTVSESLVPAVRTYIREQEEHHRTKSFTEEYRDFLRQHNVAFDERYLFD